MKLKKYNDFIKLNEEVNPTSETGYSKHNDPFINVPGNFAGADKTLVGSAVKKIFMFVKRKGFQIYLWKYLKPALSDTYLKGLLKYSLMNNMLLPSAKTYYTVSLVKDENNNEISEENRTKLLVKFKLDGKWKFEENSTVSTNKDENIQNGYYKFADFNTVFKTEDSKVVQIKDGDLDKEEKSETTSETEFETPEEIGKEKMDESSDDINELSNEIINNIEQKNIEIDKLNTYANETKTMLSNTEKGLKTIIEELKNENLTPDKKIVLESDKKVYEEDIVNLKKILNVINSKLKNIQDDKKLTLKKGDKYNYTKNDGEKIEVEFVDADEDGIILKDKLGKQFSIGKQKANRIKELAVAESLVNEELINKAAMEIGKPINTEQQKFNKISEKDLAKVNELAKRGVDLENSKEFNDQFNDDTVKDAATKIALDYSSDIVRIQLSAERLFMNNEGQVDRKLQNNWLKMVQNAKQKYAHYFNIDELDPQMLRKKLGEEVKNDKSNKSFGSRIMNNTKDLMAGLEISKNEILKDKIELSSYKDLIDNLSIINIKGYDKDEYFICYIEKLDNFYIYRILGGISDFDKFKNVQTEEEIKTLVYKDSEKIPTWFAPPKGNKQLSDGNVYITTFLIGNKNAPAEGKTSNVIPIYVYSKNSKIGKLNKDIVLYKHKRVDKKDKIELVKETNLVDVLRQPVTFNTPFKLSPNNYKYFGIDLNDTELLFKDVLNSNYGNIIRNSIFLKK